MESDVGYFGTSHSSHTNSQHGSDTYSPSFSNMTRSGYTHGTYTQASDPFQQYRYISTSQDVSSSGSPYLDRTLTPVEDHGSHSRQSPQSGSYKQETSDLDRNSGQTTTVPSANDKRKHKEADTRGSNRKERGGAGHGSGRSESRRHTGATDSEKLVSGVFIRY